jgi:hypothetical protein
VGCEDVGDGSAAEGGGARRLDGEWCAEDALARTRWTARRYSSIKPVSASDRANRARRGRQVAAGPLALEPRDGSVRSPAAIVVSSQSADVSELENTILGISFIGLANGPGVLGQWAAHAA